MKKGIVKKKYFKKMVISYTFLAALTTFILTIFFYQNYSEALLKNMYSDYQSNLRKNARSLTDFYHEEEQLYTTIVIEQQVDKYLSLTEFDPAENYLTYLKIKKLLNINPYIHSICIYNDKAKDAAFCGSRKFNAEEGWKILQELKSKTIYISELIDNKEEKLITFAYPVYTDTYQEPAGGIFINFGYDRIVDHVLGETEYTQLIIDRENQLLIEKQYQKELLSDKLLKEFYMRISASEEQTGSSKIVFDHKKLVFSYYIDALSGYKFISYTDYSSITEQLTQQRNLFLLASLLVMICSAFIQFMVSRRLYKPLGSLASEMENSKYAQETEKDEFGLILHVYENTMKEIESLEEKNALYLPKLRADLIKSILMGDAEFDKVTEALEENGWNIPFDGMFISSFKIEEWPDNSLRLVVVQARIKQLLQIHLDHFFYTESVYIDHDEVVCLINSRKDNNVSFDALVSLLEKIRDIITEEYRITLTIGLDGVVTDIKYCFHVYQKVKELQNYKFIFGYNQVIYPKCTMELLPEPLSYPDKIMADILYSLTHNDREDFDEKLEDFITTIRRYTYQTAFMLFMQLYLEAIFRLQQLGVPSLTNLSASEMLPKTLEEGKTKMQRIFEEFRLRKEEAEQIKSSKHYKKIEESKDYIAKNYRNPNLNVDMIAEVYGYSPNYFARIFKSITGFYINDYIRQIRVMKAQKLLTQSDMTIVDIAIAAGFTTPNYFYSIFKRETGLTPAAYRNVRE